jgi:hypothetical protein
MKEYFVFQGNKFTRMNLREFVIGYSHGAEPKPFIWSARLSTGLFGFPDCVSGNRGPKGINEIILSLGDDGLRKLVELGFITCPACHPENYSGFWEKIADVVEKKYASLGINSHGNSGQGIHSLEDFIDKSKLPFDARRPNWNELLSINPQAPDRLYVPQGLGSNDFIEIKNIFEQKNVALPLMGFYDRTAPGRFKEYELR